MTKTTYETIDYAFADSPFGTVLVAASAKGLCALFFVDESTDKSAERAEKCTGKVVCEVAEPISATFTSPDSRNAALACEVVEPSEECAEKVACEVAEPISNTHIESRAAALAELARTFPRAVFTERTTPVIRDALAQAFAGSTRNVPLDLRGTPFQVAVWHALMEIPEGETTTYSAIAAKTGHPKACRAAGSAVGTNPVSVIVPCHRVVRSDGSIGGYRWGIARKRAILESEKHIK